MITQQRINLWSSPRNISTALLYSFAQREDTTAVDEPLYAHYLARQPTEAVHPGREEVISAQNANGREVTVELLTHDYGTPVVVFKQMTHHYLDLDPVLLQETANVILIRDPQAILASFGKVVEGVTALDVGLPQQDEMFNQLSELGTLAAVVDARRLLEHPRTVLSKLCDRLSIPFTPAMLSWAAGPKPYDGVWAPYWYDGVHKSTGFLPYRQRDYDLSEEMAIIADQCRPIYERLLAHAL